MGGRAILIRRPACSSSSTSSPPWPRRCRSSSTGSSTWPFAAGASDSISSSPPNGRPASSPVRSAPTPTCVAPHGERRRVRRRRRLTRRGCDRAPFARAGGRPYRAAGAGPVPECLRGWAHDGGRPGAVRAGPGVRLRPRRRRCAGAEGGCSLRPPERICSASSSPIGAFGRSVRHCAGRRGSRHWRRATSLGRLPPDGRGALVVGVIDQPARQLQSLASSLPTPTAACSSSAPGDRARPWPCAPSR